MSPNKNFLNTFATILEARGKIEWLNPIRLATRYEDKKIVLLGLLIQSGAKWSFERFKVSLKLPSKEQTSSMNALWGMGAKEGEEDYTIVYYGTVLGESNRFTHNQYHRPGKWEIYLDQLTSEIDQNDKIGQALNKQPVNDSKLFPDIED